uniref:Wiskott-Aldrich syndrome protein family member n=1 Tax=Syphacia muris TaxID=451379 RepID=A0A0N5AVV4_9BILA
MPLTKRAVSPVNVSIGRIPEIVHKDELECVANGTLANLIRQLSSISKHAENIFGEIYHEAVKLDHKSNTLAQRVERLTAKVTQLGCNQEQGNVVIPLTASDLQMRKPFKSSCLIDQHTLDRQTLPSALAEKYAACSEPPNLDALNPYRDDKKSALRYYTDPSYFFDLWRQEMLKDVNDIRHGRQLKSPTGNKSPTRKKRSRHSADASRIAPPSSRYILASQQRTTDIMHLPAEYQAPQIGSIDQVKIPVGMSVPSPNDYNYVRPPQSLQQMTPVEEPPPTASSPKALTQQMAHLEVHEDTLLDDDDLPPPPPPLMHTSLVCQMPAAPVMQFVAPSVEPVSAPPPPPPPPPPELNTCSLPAPVPTFAKNEEKPDKPTTTDLTRSNLLAEIQTGIKLKQVQRKEQAAEEKAAAEANDVAAILRRRMQRVLGNSDSDSQTDDDDDDWD